MSKANQKANKKTHVRREKLPHSVIFNKQEEDKIFRKQTAKKGKACIKGSRKARGQTIRMYK